MDIYRDQIENIVWEQKKLLEYHTRELRNSQDGSLWCCMNGGKETFYHTYHKDGRYVRTAIGREPDKMKALARGEYLSVASKALEHNIGVLEKAEKNLITYDFDYLKGKMKKAYRKLPYEYFFGDQIGGEGIFAVAGTEDALKRHSAWAKEPYEKSTYKPELRRLPTSAGYKVRSKSEQHIVEQLVNYGVPHRYEQVIRAGSNVFASDWVFRDRNLELFYWEHAGMMDDPVYRARHKRKMVQLEQAGIVPWRNLIITYDNDGVINVPLIKSIIEKDVIPRL